MLALGGKAAERGLEPQRQGDFLVIQYPEPQDDTKDNLHKQALRSLYKRMDKDGAWKYHVSSMGESGFSIELRPAPVKEDKPIITRIESVPPGPVVEGLDIDLDDTEQIRRIAEEITQLAAKLLTIVAVVGIVG